MTPLRTRIEQAHDRRQPLIVPGAVDTITALLIQQLGFEAVYVSGAGLANSRLGVPDVGLVTLTEMVQQVDAMANAIDVPLVVDADAGYGNALNVYRTVRLLEGAGAAALQLEDQTSPKRCGHFDGKEVVPTHEMVAKVKAALDARRQDTLIIARTDALAVLGLQQALERVAAYAAAGADLLFVEAPTNVEDLRAIPSLVPGLHVANMVEGGKSPLLSQRELGEMGYALVLYANSAMRASLQNAREVLQHLREAGSTQQVLGRMISWEERQRLTRRETFDALGRRYATTEPE
ncbi:MAG: carboxyvinyl-carboxyphosphonate phosphorylmutase [Micromonosporaceae bacterium]|nr:carboxyvinyl-carboxyphosphonate phosphorylmutase [Micromonosporaceae bacterium]